MWRRFWSFLYGFFFVDQKTKTISHTKFFNVVGLSLMCILFPYAVIKGDAAGFEIWLAMGVIVIGSRAASKWADARSQKNDYNGYSGYNDYYGPRVDDALEDRPHRRKRRGKNKPTEILPDEE